MTIKKRKYNNSQGQMPQAKSKKYMAKRENDSFSVEDLMQQLYQGK